MNETITAIEKSERISNNIKAVYMKIDNGENEKALEWIHILYSQIESLYHEMVRTEKGLSNE